MQYVQVIYCRIRGRVLRYLHILGAIVVVVFTSSMLSSSFYTVALVIILRVRFVVETSEGKLPPDRQQGWEASRSSGRESWISAIPVGGWSHAVTGIPPLPPLQIAP